MQSGPPLRPKSTSNNRNIPQIIIPIWLKGPLITLGPLSFNEGRHSYIFLAGSRYSLYSWVLTKIVLLIKVVFVQFYWRMIILNDVKWKKKSKQVMTVQRDWGRFFFFPLSSVQLADWVVFSSHPLFRQRWTTEIRRSSGRPSKNVTCGRQRKLQGSNAMTAWYLRYRCVSVQGWWPRSGPGKVAFWHGNPILK